MCGIVGCASREQPFDIQTFISMRDVLAHRGPDDSGLWRSDNGQVMLGSRRLAILDLSPRAHQPMHDQAGNLTIVFNGEIYNFVELRDELRQHYKFRSWSDTEVLLAAYDKWGSNCVSHLNGMFAFAIWDHRREILFAARDRFGEKPFYYAQSSKAFVFASEIKSILLSQIVKAEPNDEAIYRYIAYRETDAASETLFEGIFALPAAHALLYDFRENALKTWSYWDIDPAVETHYPNDDGYAERLFELLDDSVRIRLRSDVPVGSSLSGGIDSSAIAALVSRQRQGKRQATFSARFRELDIDEGSYIQSVTDHLSLENHATYPDPKRFLEDLEQLVWHQEHPFVSVSIYAQWCVMRLAKEHGVTVLLDGQGADEILAGYHHYFGAAWRDQLMRFRWVSLAGDLGDFTELRGYAGLARAAFPQLPEFIGRPLERLRGGSGFRVEFERAFGSRPSRPPSRFRSALRNRLYQDLRSTMLPKLLRFADRSSMAFSVEVRLPFLDHRLVEYIFSIPEDQKIRGTTTKTVLRRAMRGIVPDEIVERTDKKGFEAPQSAWLEGPLRRWAEEILASREFLERPWIDSAAVQHAWKQFLLRPARNHNLIFRWLSLELWARTFMKPMDAFESMGRRTTISSQSGTAAAAGA